MPTTLVPANEPYRTKKDGNFRIHLDPRISANQLAQYMVSEASRQETIVRDCKRASRIVLASYQPARTAVYKSYDDTGINPTLLFAEADRMENTVFADAFEDKSNKLSAPAVRKFAELVPSIECDGVKVKRPSRGFDHLKIEGVRVAVQPDVVFTATHKAGVRYGGVIGTYSKGEQSSLLRQGGKYRAGDYAAFLVFHMLGTMYGAAGGSRVSDCYAADAYRSEIFQALASHKTMLKNIQAACRLIVLQWKNLPDGPAGESAATNEVEDDEVV